MSADPHNSALHRVLVAICGERETADLFAVLAVDPALLAPSRGEPISRAEVAMALAALLFADLLKRVPTGRAYVEDVRAAGGRVVFDHGALRTIRLPPDSNGARPTGAWPPGREAFARILGPLGYVAEGTYPLDRLKMTGYAFVQQDLPEIVPQYFVSELHVDRFSPAFAAAAARVFGSTRECLGPAAETLLGALAARGRCSEAEAVAGLPELAAAFGRWHEVPGEADYAALLAESAEAAWIATEGSAFNHATDRVPDVDALAAEQRAKGRPIKDAVEVSSSGRVRQTAFKADPVRRPFRAADGAVVERTVPGPFYEFITRDALPAPENGRGLDLRFDASNAQGIFKMTAAEGKSS